MTDFQCLSRTFLLFKKINCPLAHIILFHLIVGHSSPSKYSSSHSIEASQSSSTSKTNGSEFDPSPLKTRAQRKNEGTKTIPLHKQKKMSKAAKREANAIFRLSKSSKIQILPLPFLTLSLINIICTFKMRRKGKRQQLN